MIIGGLQRLTLIDYPHKLAATVFLAGCNFRCPWCYSSELVLPERIEKQPKISDKEFYNFLSTRKNLLEGIVVCGGEPCLNKDLPEFILKIKEFGYEVKIDTNGSNPNMLKKLIDNKLIDYIAMDIKGPIRKYKELIGLNFDIENIKKSASLIKTNRVDYEFRTTLVPGLLEKEDIIEIGQWLSGAKRYYLQNFRPQKTINPRFEKLKPYPEKYLYQIKEAVSPFFDVCLIR
ncbi:MAG: anaerobic ribonucleoside-triphosphate reductase activating protein [Candidatus Pacebacteria bacterium]|nr:anaerobic ribonucleoside-triphosphate reductase activating protein [Candidatus Paceibacterota bacterium]